MTGVLPKRLICFVLVCCSTAGLLHCGVAGTNNGGYNEAPGFTFGGQNLGVGLCCTELRGLLVLDFSVSDCATTYPDGSGYPHLHPFPDKSDANL